MSTELVGERQEPSFEPSDSGGNPVPTALRRIFRSALSLVGKASRLRSLSPPTEAEKENIAEFAANCSYIEKQMKAEDILSPWHDYSTRLIRLLEQRDPREFLTFDVIQETMWDGNASYAFPELKFLRRQPNWKSRWRNAIRENPFGRPSPYAAYPRSSGTVIHHTYHLAKFEEFSNLSLNEFDTVIEFGGGYGSLCRIFQNMGYRGHYVIYDLPIISALQKFYLQGAGLQVNGLNEIHSEGISLLNNSDDVFKIRQQADLTGKKVLFVGLWSLSESPLDLRKKFNPLIQSSDGFLFAYDEQYSGVDNKEYFSDLENSVVGQLKTLNEKNEHLPEQYIFMGVRRD